MEGRERNLCVNNYMSSVSLVCHPLSHVAVVVVVENHPDEKQRIINLFKSIYSLSI